MKPQSDQEQGGDMAMSLSCGVWGQSKAERAGSGLATLKSFCGLKVQGLALCLIARPRGDLAEKLILN